MAGVDADAGADASAAYAASGKEEGSTLRAGTAHGAEAAASSMEVDLHLNDISAEEQEALAALLLPKQV